MNSLQQQARFDDFLMQFNEERPHEALAMKCPAEVYAPSPRPYSGLPELAYPLHDREVLVTACSRICMHRKRIDVHINRPRRPAPRNQEVDEGIWIVSFMSYDLGFIDLEQKTLQPSTTRSARGCHPCLRYSPLPICPGRTRAGHGSFGAGEGIRTLAPSLARFRTAWQSPYAALRKRTE
jgi:hypothetical protein